MNFLTLKRWLFIILINMTTITAMEKNTTCSPTIFYLVRHGQTDWNAENRIQGQSDIPLNEVGRKESQELVGKLEGITFAAYFSSDMQRAYETALILTKADPLITIKTDKRLRERNFGSWEGRLSAEYRTSSPEERLDVESDGSMCERVFQFLTEAAHQYPGKTLLVITHGGIIRNILIQVLNLKDPVNGIAIKNAAILQLVFCNGEWSIKAKEGIELPIK
jgi:broad specificity phosphatase PhoE